MSAVKVNLFGKFCIRHNEQAMNGFEGKAKELFCYLLLHRSHPHSREIIASLLWSDSTTAQSKKYLRQALWQLQSTLNSQIEPTGSQVLLVNAKWIQLNPQADIWIDVEEFDQIFTLVQDVPIIEFDIQRAKILEHAVQLYQRDLLEGWYQEWCLDERRRLQNIYVAMLDKLVCYYETQRKYEAGLIYGTRILHFDRARESTHQQLMRLYYLVGNRTAALRQYEICIAALDEEFNTRPTKHTVEVYEQIKADRLAVAPNEGGTIFEGLTAPLSEETDQLKHLFMNLRNIQYQLQQCIDDIEQYLSG